MKSKDLEFLKKRYGESFAKYCRTKFSTILEEEGLLAKIISEAFHPNKSLYEDIVASYSSYEFENFVYAFLKDESQNKTDADVTETPEELMKKAGYDLYKCESHDDIISFMKYYKAEEALCTFMDENRINTHHVFFAVKENVDEIKRENFATPFRQDEYGTSVISIQFTKGESNILSIKNRYNHVVINCDATFSNNLENIIPGLTKSFSDAYRLNLSSEDTVPLDLPNYVRAKDGKFYKYNYEIQGVYYCPDNIIINEEKEPVSFDKNKYILLDYFLLDLENKTLTLPDANWLSDSFIDDFNAMNDNSKISVKKEKDSKVITISRESKEDVVIALDNKNRIVKYSNANITSVGDGFLQHNQVLDEISIPNAVRVGNDFLSENLGLKKLSLEKVDCVGNDFLRANKELESIHLPNVIEVGNKFLHANKDLNKLELPSVQEIGDYFLSTNKQLNTLIAPRTTNIGRNFLWGNKGLKRLSLPSARYLDKMFLYSNNALKELYLPNATYIGVNFLRSNKTLRALDITSAKHIGTNFMYDHPNKKEFYENLGSGMSR